MRRFFDGRTVLTVFAVLLVGGIATAGAAKLITGADVKNRSLTGLDVKNGSLFKRQLHPVIQGKLNRLPIVVPGLPTQRWLATNSTVAKTPDGVQSGPYADGGAEGGSLCTNVLDGQPLNAVSSLVYNARYTATGDTGGVGVPYLRIFLSDDHDVIFSPNTQPPDPDVAEGPFHTWVATAGLWRYDDDGGSGGEYGVNGAPFSDVLADHGDESIETSGSNVCITTGFSSGADLTSLIRSFKINAKTYTFSG